jgi:hypothetical protein
LKGLFGLSNDQNQPEMDLERAGRFIHHLPGLYRPHTIVFEPGSWLDCNKSDGESKKKA